MEQAAIAPAAHDAHASHGTHETSTGVTNTKLAMWIFLSSECLLFGALIATYLLYRGRSKGLSPSDVYNIPFTSATSFILLMSSLTMVLAPRRDPAGRLPPHEDLAHRHRPVRHDVHRRPDLRVHRVHPQGAHVDTNLFGSSFYLLTGLHGLHVTVGIVWLLSMWGLVSQGKLQQRHSETIEIAGLVLALRRRGVDRDLHRRLPDPALEVGRTHERRRDRRAHAGPRAQHARRAPPRSASREKKYGLEEIPPEEVPLLPGELTHHPSPFQYVVIAMILVVITAVEVGVSYLDGDIPEGPDHLRCCSAWAWSSSSLVASYYMHLKTDKPVFRRFFIHGRRSARSPCTRSS